MHSKVTVLESDDAIKVIYSMRHEKANSLVREIGSNLVFKNVGNVPLQSWDNDIFWNNVIEKRKKNGCFLHMLVDISDDSEDYHRSNEKQFKEVRLVPEDFKIAAGMNIFGNKVAIHNTKTVDVVGIIIDDATISSLCTSFFDFVWKRSKVI